MDLLRLDALLAAGFSSATPVNRDEEAEPMYVLHRRKDEVAPVATLEHLVLMYLYSNQPRHMGDLARIVTESDVRLGDVERYLMEVHPEMLAVLRERVQAARNPPPAPPRPKHRRR